MAFPVLIFLGGAALGATAAWILKDRIRSGMIGRDLEPAVDAMEAAGDRVVRTAEAVLGSLSETAQGVSETVPETSGEAVQPAAKTAKRRAKSAKSDTPEDMPEV